MERSSSISAPLILGLVAGGLTAQAGLDAWGTTPNRLGISLRTLFNVEATFTQLGGSSPATDIGPASGGADHFYDDGYNRVDSSGNADGTTWFWGYDRVSQADGAGILMSSTAAQGTGRLDQVSDDPHWGGELVYRRELGWNNSYSWGLVTGLGWQDLRFRESASFVGNAVRVTDSYSLLGQPPPTAPYRGEFDRQGGPVLAEVPIRETSVIPGGASTAGEYELRASAYTFRLGLLFETPFAEQLDLQFGGGVLGSVIHGEFTFREQTMVADLNAITARGSGHSTEFAGGGYAELNLSLRVSKGAYAFVGAQYQLLTDYSQEVDGHKVELEFDSGVAAVLGLNFAF